MSITLSFFSPVLKEVASSCWKKKPLQLLRQVFLTPKPDFFSEKFFFRLRLRLRFQIFDSDSDSDSEKIVRLRLRKTPKNSEILFS